MPSAIVLTLTRYSDTGSIVHLYTAEHGRMQYVVYGNKYKGILRPLSIIEFTATRRQNAPNQLSTLSSCQLATVNSRLSSDVQRQCVAMFIAEVLANTLRHPMGDEPLYDWLCQIILHLDQDAETSRSERQQRLRELTAYYEEHIEDFRTPKSLDVLIEVFD